MKKLFFALIGIILALVAIISVQVRKEQELRQELQRETANTSSLLASIERYKTADSLNVSNVTTLLLTLDEYKTYRAEDAKELKALRLKNRDLASVAKLATKQTAKVQTITRDSIVWRDDLVVDTLNCIDISDDYFVMHGCIDGDKFDGVYAAYDSLIIVESVQYKRALGFLWKTKRVKDRRLDVLSKNPNAYVQDVEHIIIYK